MKHPDWTRDDLTFGDILHPAMEVKTEEEAQDYLEHYIRYMMRKWGRSRAKAEENARANIGYWTGYHDSKTARRVMTLFGAAHPIFGTSRPEPAEALAAGKKMAKEG